MATFSVHVDMTGPIFEGKAPGVLHDMLHEAVSEIGDRAHREIVAEAWTMNKSGRAGTGPGGFWAPRNVYMYDNFSGGLGDDTVVIQGGQKTYFGWWPWLEGTSKRNASTSFGGYHTFQRTADRWQKLAGLVLEDAVARHMDELGGT
jgi:hypothetical protein